MRAVYVFAHSYGMAVRTLQLLVVSLSNVNVPFYLHTYDVFFILPLFLSLDGGRRERPRPARWPAGHSADKGQAPLIIPDAAPSGQFCYFFYYSQQSFFLRRHGQHRLRAPFQVSRDVR